MLSHLERYAPKTKAKIGDIVYKVFNGQLTTKQGKERLTKHAEGIKRYSLKYDNIKPILSKITETKKYLDRIKRGRK